jgi:UDP-2,3-diacylglucosamine hydrolase
MKKTYFLSDAHLGSLAIADNRSHEKHLVNFLDSIKEDAEAIYLLGDMFDFWYEYKMVVPKGFVRFLGKLAELADNGVQIHFFTGNHDMWTFGYLEKEIGLTVHRQEEEITIHGKNFLLAHGDMFQKDGFGGFLIKKIFRNRFLQELFTSFPPRLGLKFGYWWAKTNRLSDNRKEYKYEGEEKETLVQFAKEYIKNHDIDYFVFGHRHILLDLQLKNKSRVLILGDWMYEFSYAVFDGNDISLHNYEITTDNI